MCEGAVNVGGAPSGDNPARAANSPLADAGDVNCAVKVGFATPMGMTVRYDASTRSVQVNQSAGGSLFFKGIPGNATASRDGITRRGIALGQFLKADMTPCTDNSPAFVKIVQGDGSSQTLDLASGQVHSMTTRTGAVIPKSSFDSQVEVTRNSLGDIERIASSRDGVLEFARTPNRLTISQFPPARLARNARGETLPQGTPVKVYTYEWNPSVRTMSITTQEAGHEALVKERRIEGNKTIITEGSGDERIVTTYERNMLPGDKWEEIKTVQGFRETAPSFCERVVKKYTDGGWLVLSRTEGYGTALARTTSYTYNSQFRVSVKALPDGGYTRYEYDSQGRVTMEASPWTDGDYEYVVRTTYADLRFNDCRPATRQVSLEHVSTGEETVLKTTTFTYEDSPLLNRITTSILAAGETVPLVKIRELYGEQASNEYSRGRTRMKQGFNGVQKVAVYEDTTSYGARWKITTETRVNGAVMPGRSERTIQYIAEDETLLRNEKYVHTGQGWSLVSSAGYEYDGEKRLIKTTRGNGRVSTAEWGCCGPLRRVDEDGVILSYGYNSARQLVEIIRSATATTPESITTYTRDSFGRALSIREDIGAMSRTTARTYDILGRLTSETDSRGLTTAYSYQNKGLRKVVTLPAGAQETTDYNKDSSLHALAAAGKRPVSYSYAAEEAFCTTIRSYSSSRVPGSEETDWLGRKRREYLAPVDSSLAMQLVAEKSYNAKNQLVSESRLGVPFLYEYDAMGKLSRKLMPLSPEPTPQNSRIVEYVRTYEERADGVYSVVTATSYDASGQPLSRSRAQLVSELSPTLESKTVSTDLYGNVIIEWTQYDGDGKRTWLRTIPTSSVTAEIRLEDGFATYRKDHSGTVTTASRSFTSAGTTVTETDGRGIAVTVKRDPSGRVVLVRDGAGKETATAYDPVTGLPSLVTNALGFTTCYKYDSCARLTAVYGTGVQPVCCGYDANGNLSSLTTFRVPSGSIVTDPTGRTDGDTTTWVYAWQGDLPIQKNYPDATSEHMAYGAMNRLISTTNVRGATSSRTYNPLTGELLSIVSSDAATPSVTYSYNHLGWITGVTDGSGTRTVEYNHYGDITGETFASNASDYSLLNSYDAHGRLDEYGLSSATSSLFSTAIGYAADGRIGTAVLTSGTLEQSFAFDYLPGSEFIRSISLPGSLLDERSYEPDRDLLASARIRKSSSSSSLAERSYSYDDLSRLTARSQKRGSGAAASHSFSYNGRGELTGATLGTDAYQYAYDNIGNRQTATETGTSTAYTANSLDQYTLLQKATESFTPAYDADGNQTKILTSTGIWNVLYDAWNRPVRFTSSDGATVVECGYDAEGRRHSKKVTLQGSVIILHERYLYRGYVQVATLNLQNGSSVNHALLWDPTAPRATRPLALVKNHQAYLFGHDQNKNVTEVFDITGRLVGQYDYSPFGKKAFSGTVASPVQWGSEVCDEETGLVYYNYRYYNPQDGRWVSRDPLGEEGGLNLYAFAGNRMVSDWMGLEEESGSGSTPVPGDPGTPAPTNGQTCPNPQPEPEEPNAENEDDDETDDPTTPEDEDDSKKKENGEGGDDGDNGGGGGGGDDGEPKVPASAIKEGPKDDGIDLPLWLKLEANANGGAIKAQTDLGGVTVSTDLAVNTQGFNFGVGAETSIGGVNLSASLSSDFNGQLGGSFTANARTGETSSVTAGFNFNQAAHTMGASVKASTLLNVGGTRVEAYISASGNHNTATHIKSSEIRLGISAPIW